MTEKNEAIKVELVNPPIQDAWRTHLDYIVEQKQDTVRFWGTITSLVVSILSVVLTAYTDINAINRACS